MSQNCKNSPPVTWVSPPWSIQNKTSDMLHETFSFFVYDIVFLFTLTFTRPKKVSVILTLIFCKGNGERYKRSDLQNVCQSMNRLKHREFADANLSWQSGGTTHYPTIKQHLTSDLQKLFYLSECVSKFLTPSRTLCSMILGCQVSKNMYKMIKMSRNLQSHKIIPARNAQILGEVKAVEWNCCKIFSLGLPSNFR